MLTIIGISLVNSKSLSSIPLMIFSQILFGLLIGIFFAIIGLFIIKKTTIISNGLDTIFMISLVLAAFGSSMYLNGNALLSVYLLGIILGNSKIKCNFVVLYK
jgi:cell volume regulation protein A